MNTCACGCGRTPSRRSRFVAGHHHHEPCLVVQVPGGTEALLLTRNRGLVRIEADDAPELGLVGWRVGPHGYAIRNAIIKGRRVQLKMHRCVLGLGIEDLLVADHLNRDRTDNRRVNLRALRPETNSQNQAGRGEHPRGVSARPTSTGRERYRARVKSHGQEIHLGTFGTPEEAASAAASWRARHMPFSEDFARDNKNAPATHERPGADQQEVCS